MQQTTDCLLLQFRLEAAPTEGLAAAAARFCTDRSLHLQRLAHAPQTGEAYLYARAPARAQLDDTALPALAAALEQQLPQAHDTRVSRLEQVFVAPGQARAQTPLFHYVVEMDPDAGWMPEIERWYDTEHMPGLAAVPGCIHALRFLNHDQGPLSLACYDLVAEEVLGSPPWLAIRGTAWSSLTRPHFTNTKRTMFRVLA